MGRQDHTTAPPIASSPESLRNVVLVGPSGSGKTRLFDHLLGTTTPGYRAPARDGGRSTSLQVASISSGDLVVNLLDTPGYADFVGELRAGLRAADAAIFVISAADGVDAATRTLWHECKQVGAPLAVVLTKLDTPHADFDSAVADCQAAFGEGVMPLGVPVMGEGGELEHIVDLVLGEVHDYTGEQRVVRPRARSTSGSSTPTTAPCSRASSPRPRTTPSSTGTSAARRSASRSSRRPSSRPSPAARSTPSCP